MERIGIANCIAFDREAAVLEDQLREGGFEVAKANCKLGRIPFKDLLPDYKGVSCNPAGQASFLAAHNTELKHHSLDALQGKE